MNWRRGIGSAARRELKPPTAFFALAVLTVLLVRTDHVRAEQLPLRTYTIADGLANDNINRIVRDSRGFLWFCTEEGLSRFDGRHFVNYSTRDGLPHRNVTDLVETRDGQFWIGTFHGIARFNPTGAPVFVTYLPGADENSWQVQRVVADRDGVIWCGTSGGLYRLTASGAAPIFHLLDLGMPGAGGGAAVQALLADRQGAIWAGTTTSGLYRHWPGGRTDHFTTRNGLPADGVSALVEDRAGRVWAGTPRGLAEFDPAPPATAGATVSRRFGVADGLASDWIEAVFESTSGTLWVGTDGGLSQGLPAASRSGARFRPYTTTNGLSSRYVMAMAEDRDGNLWLGTDSGGAMKLARGGFTTYSEADGLASAGVDAIFESRSGDLCAVSSGTKHFISWFDGQRFRAVWPAFPQAITQFGWGWNQVTLQARSGEWWVPTGQGLVRFPAVAHVDQLAFTAPMAVYSAGNGLPFDDVFRLFEDSQGGIWISTVANVTNGLSRWDPVHATLHTFSEADGLMPLTVRPPSAFAEDDAGRVWIGHWMGGLSRYDNGRFTSFDESAGLPRGTIRSLFIDHDRRLWIASSAGGLARLDDPLAPQPHFTTYTTADGLSSDDVWCITEDALGRLYVGTGRGLDRIDLRTGHITHYTTGDGLVLGKVTSAFRDRRGALWFASNVHGLSRLAPEPDPAAAPPSVFLTGLTVGGEARALSRLGETVVSGIDVGPNQTHVGIDFVGLSFRGGGPVRFQYQLEGADHDWNAITDAQSVTYQALAPGRYRFLVRAIDADGLASLAPATVSLTVQPPVWRRWWFLALSALGLGLLAFVFHRQRVARLVELERIRTRIATDLHDDIGANLSLIAMLSEVAGTLPESEAHRLKESLGTIASTSRDSVDAMSDIVWAVDPSRDQLRDLTQRMRRFAEDSLGGRGVDLVFSPPRAGGDLTLGADVRREVFLIFKEAVTNIVRHSHATAAEIGLDVLHGSVVLEVRDNGAGTGAAARGAGNGLLNMQRRAKRVGGCLDVVFEETGGTRVTLRVRVDRRTAG